MDKWKDIELEKMKVGELNHAYVYNLTVCLCGYNRIGFSYVNLSRCDERPEVIKKHVNFSIANLTTTTQCRYNKSTIQKRPLYTVIRYRHWLKANRGVKVRRQH